MTRTLRLAALALPLSLCLACGAPPLGGPDGGPAAPDDGTAPSDPGPGGSPDGGPGATPDAGAPTPDGGSSDPASGNADAGSSAPPAAEPDAGAGDGATDGGSSEPVPTGGEACALDPNAHAGEGTYYGYDQLGACGIPGVDPGGLFAALNPEDYAGSATCGACLDVVGPEGRVTVPVVDLCPECLPGDVDLSQAAFAQLAPLSAGRIPISWTVVPCDPPGALRYQFDSGSNPWWWGVRVLDARHPVVSVEVRQDGGPWTELPRMDWNLFVAEPPDGSFGPFDVRVTDVLGESVVEPAVTVEPGAVIEGTVQLPACAP